MGKINQSLLNALKKTDPDVKECDLVSLAAANLDVNDPQKQNKTLIAMYLRELRVYVDETLTLCEPIENIEAIKTVIGVGCVFVHYVRKSDGESVCFARADSRYQVSLAHFTKCATHYLRYHDLDFSRITGSAGKICPKCGRPYPRGSTVCPRCTSKKKALRRLLSLAKKELKYIIATVILFFATTAIGLAVPYINRVLVDDYIQNTSGNIYVWGFIGVIASLLLTTLLRRGIGMLRGYFLTIGGNNLVLRLRDMVFRKIQELSIAKIANRTSGELMKRVNGDTNQIKNFLINQLPNLLEQLLVLGAIGIVLLVYDWRLALLVIVPAPLVALAFKLFWGFMRAMFHRSWVLNSKGSAVLHDIFSGIRVVKAYGREEQEEERFLEISAQERDAQLRQERAWALLMPMLQFLMGVGEFFLLFYVGQKMLDGKMTPGEMSQFSSYAGMLLAPLSALMNFPRNFMQMMTSLNRVFEIMDETVEIINKNDQNLTDLEGRIDVNHVSFGYDDADEVLHDIDLHINPGEFIGLVGKSGTGKSTMINLIMRMYDVDEGNISIDGVDIRDIPQDVLRSRMGVVLQENFLFAGSVMQNLKYAKPDATREEVIQAAKAAGAHEFIIRLPNGYNTTVGEKGYTLSGGERQRLAIARALLHNPKILILDEATSSLDTETEKLIQDALQMLSKGRTTIAIAHRLSTLRHATRLVVLDKGMVAETGTHDELMEKQGIYYRLVMAQREMTKIEARSNS